MTKLNPFTADNCEFSAAERAVLNAAAALLLAGVDAHDHDAIKAITDSLNDYWREGDTVETLLRRRAAGLALTFGGEIPIKTAAGLVLGRVGTVEHARAVARAAGLVGATAVTHPNGTIRWFAAQ